MQIEDNSDLRAAVTFAHNALKRVLHVFIITHDAPKPGRQQEDSFAQNTVRGVKIGDTDALNFSNAVKEMSYNQEQSLYQIKGDPHPEVSTFENELVKQSWPEIPGGNMHLQVPEQLGQGTDSVRNKQLHEQEMALDTTKMKLKKKKSLAFRGTQFKYNYRTIKLQGKSECLSLPRVGEAPGVGDWLKNIFG